jgi:hypothetical protein
VSSRDAETPAVVAHPLTGEVLVDLDQQPPELLAHALVVVRDRTAALAAGQRALERELRRRLKILDRKTAVFGEWEVEATTTRESEWDVDELERAMAQLIDDGVIRAAEVTDVVTRTPTVSRSKAKALRDRLDGAAREQVAAALVGWHDKPTKLTVARSVALPTAEEVKAFREPAPPPSLDGAPRPLTPEELFA